MTGDNEAREAVAALLADETQAVLAVGAPRCGKTRFATRALLDGLAQFGNDDAAMTVSGRVAADSIGNEVIRRIGASCQVRPVTTLQAIAFRVLTAARKTRGDTAPRLLNGAEQDALLRGILAAHLAHAERGDDCATCRLLRTYFARDDWGGMVAAPAMADAATPDGGAPDAVPEHAAADGSTTAAVLARGISDAFVAQLRDMLARMDELGVGESREGDALDALSPDTLAADRLRVQWRLAFALRREYRRAVADSYPGECRLDSSRLFVEGAQALAGRNAAPVPKLLVVDDLQDTTLAGLRFLEALAGAGTRLLLVGNPDEAVQTFRGSYPEYLFARVCDGALHARLVRLTAGQTGSDGTRDGGDYRGLVAARVSLSIPSPEDDPVPLPQRPGKLPQLPGSLPIAPLAQDSPLPGDGTLRTALYRSPREELDDVVWRIKRSHLDGGADWNSMAVIAHDNATVRTFGERLRRDGVPVRYSSVVRPLNDEPFVQGLFALIELARLRRQGVRRTTMAPAGVAAYVRVRVETLMASPLVTTAGRPAEGRPARMEPVAAAMRALASLAGVVGEPATDGGSDGAMASGEDARDTTWGSDAHVPRLMAAWTRLRQDLADAKGGDAQVETDDHLVDAAAPEDAPTGIAQDGASDGAAPEDGDLAFGVDALYVMLAFDDPQAPAADAEDAIEAVIGADPQSRAFAHLWSLVASVAKGLERLTTDDALQVLALAWDATGVAKPWQRAALANTPEGRAANDRLDVAMRLFQFAEETSGQRDIASFIARVRSLRIGADSLAHIGPVEQAVTLTTPAGAAGRHWAHVWMPAIQQDVWPNLAERNTLFGGEDLADVALRGAIEEGDGHGHDPRLASVLAGEKKGLLVALTRADAEATLSAVWNDDLTPSDFLFGYLPERFVRDRAKARFATVGAPELASGISDTPGAGRSRNDDRDAGTEAGSAPAPALDAVGLDADPRGLVAAARATLATHPVDSPEGRDAVAALALLARHGIADADPGAWNFLDDPADGVSGDTSASASTPPAVRDAHPVAKLSPSAADGLWGCPVCWLLEQSCSGPRPGSVATNFGTLIHEVARIGSEEGLDRSDFLAGHGVDARIEQIADRLLAIYRGMRTDPTAIADPEQRYRAISKDEHAAEALANVATYFVTSNEPDYPAKNAKYFQVGTLLRADCEVSFAARFALEDIRAAYLRVPDAVPLDAAEFYALMGSLVGGWPDGMAPDLEIRLSGRIDRMETRTVGGAGAVTRLIDYKTGAKPSGQQIVNDLQLVCYQLGLAFPEDGPGGAEALDRMPRITQSALFHVAQSSAPAESHAPEGLFQPPLFVDGALNAEPFIPRYYYSDMAKLLETPALGEQAPAGIGQGTWDRLRKRLGGTQTLWAMAMIARVIYAGAALRSTRIEAHPTKQHQQHCRMRAICPACAGSIDTVYETRHP